MLPISNFSHNFPNFTQSCTLESIAKFYCSKSRKLIKSIKEKFHRRFVFFYLIRSKGSD